MDILVQSAAQIADASDVVTMDKGYGAVTSLQDDPDRQREVQLLVQLRRVAPANDRRRLLEQLYPVASDLSVPALRELSLADDDGARVVAILTLGSVGTEAAVSALAESLEQQSTLGIDTAARVLLKLADRRAVPALVACLLARGGELTKTNKLLIIAALAAMPHRSEVPALAAALSDPNRRVRRAAARALERLDMPEAEAALQDAAQELSWFAGLPTRRALNRRHQGRRT